MQLPDIINQLTPDQIKFVAIASLGVLGSIGLIVLRVALKTLKREWAQAKTGINAMNSRLTTITENHLAHVQEHTGRTVELLERMVNEQAEMNGFLRGKLERD